MKQAGPEFLTDVELNQEKASQTGEFYKVNVVETTGGFYQSLKLNNAILRESWGGVDCTEYRSAVLTGS